MGIPLKGAIARGMITCDSSKQLFFGQALIDAYLLEESIQYYGLLAHHTVEEYAIELSSKLYRNVSAPLKSGAVGHYELMWYSNGQQSLEDIKEWLTNIRHTVSDSPRKYIDNTLNVINEYGKVS